MRRPFILSALLILAAGALAAQDTPPCADEKSHEFDFWIGEWQVWSGDDSAGTNSIQPILDGCVLQESWLGARGSAGSSFNFYNPQTGKWQQFWVWRRGTTLELSGGYAEGKMTLEGDSVGRDGETVRNRITWYDNEDQTVRQHWQVSKDNGKTWQTAFDGLYRRKK
jgi:hypothetical protein